MKLPAIFVALVALALAACQKKADTGSNEDAQPAEVAPDATPEPKPVAVVATPAATPAPELAPSGRYFARRKLSIETDAGIVGIPAGTALEQTAPGQYRTLDGQTLAASDADVTNRLDEARALVGADRAAQAALRSAASAAVDPEPPIAPPAEPPPNASAAWRELYGQERQLQIKVQGLYAELRKLSNRNPKESPAAERIHNEMDRVRAQIRAVQAKRATVR